MPDVKLLKYSSEKEKAHTHGEVDGFHLVYSNRRRSCALVNTPSPCVNKAIHHIQEIERKIEVWFEQLDVALLESSEHLDIDESTLRSCTNSFDPGTICIEGKGISGKECDKVASLREEAKAVLLEIIDLIVRLETDRQEAEEALKKERERKIKLVQKIDFLSLWRLQHLPAAVQKEHEACARDINELLWHLQRKKERLKEIKERLQQAEIQNRRLLEDIGFVEKHAPLVKEKLACESNILHEIEKAQDEANEIFSKCSNELQSVQQLFDETESKANAERDKMSMELNDITSNLNAQIHELDQFELYSRACLKKMAEIQRNLIERENEDRFLKIQISNQSECEQILKDEFHLVAMVEDGQHHNGLLVVQIVEVEFEPWFDVHLA
ncbi:coiled-coil domain-containing protein 178 [Erpetoichthys calabaricus]|uniref:coiled-coil domain-containing protein 178 n=1 Tax=Erpetoichthys calabaricus TaxID=27687 RepID=UPI002233EECD|nr:coiled-coil domain-containing protein 178 [Erpetoichthys calabaricus]